MRRLSAAKVLACLLLVATAARAQQYVFNSYRQPEGLKNLSINAMTSDREGFLWVATENGVFRFLGSSFERFGTEQGIAEMDVLTIVADPNGTVWAGTEGNVYRWDGHRFQAAGKTPISTVNDFGMAIQDDRHLLVVDNRHLFRLEHDAADKTLSYTPVFSDALIAAHPLLGHVVSVSVVREPGGGIRIWFGCGTKLCSLADRHPDSQAREEDLTEWGTNRDLPEDRWDSVLLDREGTLWAGADYHVAALPRGRQNFIDRTIPGSDPRSIHSHAPLVEDRQGRVLAPANTEVARWSGGSWQNIGGKNGLHLTGGVVGMTFDQEGDLWLSVQGNGLYNWAGYNEWEGWTADQGLPSAMIWDLIPFGQGRILAGTDKGPAWISKETGTAAPLFQGKWSFGEVNIMGVDRDGSLWAGTSSGGILRVDPRMGGVKQIAKLPVSIIDGVIDRAGRLFLGTMDGVWTRGAGRDGVRFNHVDLPLPSRTRVEAGCLAPNGDVWFLAPNRILREIDGVWTEPPIDGLPQLPSGLLTLSCARDGSLWTTGEQTGVWRLTPHGDRLQAQQLQVPPEMQSLAPLAILADRRGWIWLGTDLGVLVWNGHEWRHLSQESGLIWNDIDQGALAEDPDGSIWIGTSAGLSHLLHPEQVFDPQPIGISVAGIENGSQHLSDTNSLVLHWTPLPFAIQITSPTMRNRSELMFEYRMKGLHPGWIESKNGEAIFSELPPGNYTFSARAVNPDLNATSETLQMHISVLPPWWRTWWMLALYVLGLAGGLWGLHRLYENHLVARGKELESLVSERTRELEDSRAQLRIQATHDEMTGMLNRTAILATLSNEMRRAVRDSIAIAVALVDLDHFKRINDVCGHLAGDDALRLFAEAVRKAVRTYDHAGRYGGEEFLLVLCGIPLPEIRSRMIEVQRAISNLPFQWKDKEFTLNCSAGVAVFDLSDCLCTIESLLSAADQALYLAKASGRNCVVFSEDCRPAAKDGQFGERHLSIV